MQFTKHTNSGEAIKCDHKYLFENTGDWSLCSDNAFKPGSNHVQFDVREHSRYSIGTLLTTFNFANTTTVLQFFERLWRLRIYTVACMMGHTPYTMGGPVDYKAPLVEIPCNLRMERPQSMNGGLLLFTTPCGGNLLNEGHLEQIVNHAVHIVYTEGPRTVEGPGFKLEYEDSGGDFVSSNTRITIWFYFNGYPIWVRFVRQRAQGDDSRCARSIRPAHPSFKAAVPPPKVDSTYFKVIVSERAARENAVADAPPAAAPRPTATGENRVEFLKKELSERLCPLISEFEPTHPETICDMVLDYYTEESLLLLHKSNYLCESVVADLKRLSARGDLVHFARTVGKARHDERQARITIDKVNDGERRERERQAHIAVVEANDALEKQEAKVAELKRKLQASQSRAAKAAAPPKPYTARQEPPRSKKAEKKQARKDKRHTKYESMGAQLEHDVHTSEEQRALRAEAFNMRQMVIHAEAEASKAKERLEAAKKLKADMSAEYEAAVHVVPPRSTLSAIIGNALDAAVM